MITLANQDNLIAEGLFMSKDALYVNMSSEKLFRFKLEELVSESMDEKQNSLIDTDV